MDNLLKSLRLSIVIGLLCVAANGQVGIGVDQPQAMLDISSTNSGILIPRVNLTGNNDATTILQPDGSAPAVSTLVYNLSSTGSGSTFISSGFHFWNGSLWVPFVDQDWLSATTGTIPIDIDDDIYTNGNVGIRTSNPNYPLDVAGSVRVRSGNNILVGDGDLNTDNGLRISHDGTNSYFDFKGNSTLFRGSPLGTGSGDQTIMRIDNSNGFVAIGNTDPLEKLHVQNGNVRIDTDFRMQFGEYYENTDPIHFIRTNLASDRSELQLLLGDNSGATDPNADFFKIGVRDNATGNFIEKFSFSASGVAAKPGGGSWAGLSDKRVKKNIQPYSRGLKEILSIRPVTFEYNDLSGYGDTGKTHIGVIAQEIKEVLPQTVSISANEHFDDLHVFDPSSLTYTLINAVKEMATENKDLESRLLRLEELAEKLENEKKAP